MYKRIIHLFVLSCDKATFLMEKRFHTSLNMLEKMQLRIHLSICKNCTAYQRKALLINQWLTNTQTKKEPSNPFSEKEITDLKNRFKSAIKYKESAPLK